MNFLKNIFYKTIIVEKQLLRKPKKNEIAILTLPDASAEDVIKFIDFFTYAQKNNKQILFTNKQIKISIVDKKTKVQK